MFDAIALLLEDWPGAIATALVAAVAWMTRPPARRRAPSPETR